jgi:5-formyltetrahydrofolate cyclo-ligase
MDEISLAKVALREQILNLRKKSNYSAERLTRNLLTVVQQHKPERVATYVSLPSEPSTQNFIRALLDQGIWVLVPETLDEGKLSWHEFLGHADLSLLPGDLLFVPALAVDRYGNRLGRGKGYFDRELAGLAGVYTYAVVFESEIIDQVPTEDHDQRVDGVVTEDQILKIN